MVDALTTARNADRATERRWLAELAPPHLRNAYAALAIHANELESWARLMPEDAEVLRARAAAADYVMGLGPMPRPFVMDCLRVLLAPPSSHV